jgi:hypothetical protein
MADLGDPNNSFERGLFPSQKRGKPEKLKPKPKPKPKPEPKRPARELAFVFQSFRDSIQAERIEANGKVRELPVALGETDAEGEIDVEARQVPVGRGAKGIPGARKRKTPNRQEKRTLEFVYEDEIETELIRAVPLLQWPCVHFPQPEEDQIQQDYELALRLFEQELDDPENFPSERPKRAKKLTATGVPRPRSSSRA